jgi:hypothetical protein
MVDDDDIKTLVRCRHRFHRGCIDRWLGERRICPRCGCFTVKADRDTAVRVKSALRRISRSLSNRDI